MRRENCRILDKGGIGVAEVGFESREFEAALSERIAILRVLRQNHVEIWRAETDGGEAVGKVVARDAYDGMSKQAVCSCELKVARSGIHYMLRSWLVFFDRAKGVPGLKPTDSPRMFGGAEAPRSLPCNLGTPSIKETQTNRTGIFASGHRRGPACA